MPIKYIKVQPDGDVVAVAGLIVAVWRTAASGQFSSDRKPIKSQKYVKANNKYYPSNTGSITTETDQIKEKSRIAMLEK